MAKKIFRKKFLSANGKKFLRVGSVALRYDTTASTIWRWAREARFSHLNFSKPVKIGPNTTVWPIDELDRWDAERIAERDDVDADARVAMKAAERDDVDADGNDAQGEDDDADDEDEAA